MTHTQALTPFMTHLIDYAGLFPPAKLPLREAFANYLTYLKGDDRWLLGRFIIPVSQLPQLAQLIEETAACPPLELSLLGRTATDEPHFLANLQADLQQIDQFLATISTPVTTPVFELKLPPVPTTQLSELINQTNQLLQPKQIFPFFEPAPHTSWLTHVKEAIPALVQHTNVGIKLRCGGVTAALFPSLSELAEALYLISQTDLPLKATAGLHHPIRHFNASVDTKMHGFLNLFGATMLSRAYQLSPAQIEEILADEAAENFQFDQQTFHWQTLHLSIEELDQLRRTATSYGSCSFDEPREDLTALQLL